MARFTIKAARAGFGAVLLAAAALSLGGCETLNGTMTSVKDGLGSIEWPRFGSDEENAENAAATAASDMATDRKGCPPINTLPELAAVTRFSSDTEQRADNMVSELHLTRIGAKCDPQGDSMTIDLALHFEGMLGPKADRISGPDGNLTYSYPYFIAVIGRDGTVLAKEVFSASVTYNKGQAATAHVETVRQTVPAQGGFADVVLMAGFQLTDPELSYNRSFLAAAPQGDMPAWPPGVITQEESARVEPVAAAPIAAPPVNETEAATAAAIAAAEKPRPAPKKKAPPPEHKPTTPVTAAPVTAAPQPAVMDAPAATPADQAPAMPAAEATAVTDDAAQEEMAPSISIAPEPATQPAADGVVNGAEPPSFPSTQDAIVKPAPAPALDAPSLENDAEWTTGTDITAPLP